MGQLSWLPLYSRLASGANSIGEFKRRKRKRAIAMGLNSKLGSNSIVQLPSLQKDTFYSSPERHKTLPLSTLAIICLLALALAQAPQATTSSGWSNSIQLAGIQVETLTTSAGPFPETNASSGSRSVIGFGGGRGGAGRKRNPKSSDDIGQDGWRPGELLPSTRTMINDSANGVEPKSAGLKFGPSFFENSGPGLNLSRNRPLVEAARTRAAASSLAPSDSRPDRKGGLRKRAAGIEPAQTGKLVAEFREARRAGSGGPEQPQPQQQAGAPLGLFNASSDEGGAIDQTSGDSLKQQQLSAFQKRLMELKLQYLTNRAISDRAYYVFLVIYTLFIIVGTISNFLICLTVILKPKILSARNIFIVNLASSDLLLCVFTMPFSFIEMSMKMWQMGVIPCKLVAGLQATSIFVSTMSITAIALDRYKVIVYPTHQETRNSVRKAALVLTSVWFCALLLALPLFRVRTVQHKDLPPKYTTIKSVDFCVEDWPFKNGRRIYSVLSMIFQYVLPITIVSVVYAKISDKLQKRLIRRQKSTQLECQQKRQLALIKRTHTMLISVSLIFGLSWLPLNLLNVFGDLIDSLQADEQLFRIVFAICHLIGCSSALSNPILYGYLNENFRKELQQVYAQQARRILRLLRQLFNLITCRRSAYACSHFSTYLPPTPTSLASTSSAASSSSGSRSSSSPNSSSCSTTSASDESLTSSSLGSQRRVPDPSQLGQVSSSSFGADLELGQVVASLPEQSRLLAQALEARHDACPEKQPQSKQHEQERLSAQAGSINKQISNNIVISLAGGTDNPAEGAPKTDRVKMDKTIKLCLCLTSTAFSSSETIGGSREQQRALNNHQDPWEETCPGRKGPQSIRIREFKVNLVQNNIVTSSNHIASSAGNLNSCSPAPQRASSSSGSFVKGARLNQPTLASTKSASSASFVRGDSFSRGRKRKKRRRRQRRRRKLKRRQMERHQLECLCECHRLNLSGVRLEAGWVGLSELEKRAIEEKAKSGAGKFERRKIEPANWKRASANGRRVWLRFFTLDRNRNRPHAVEANCLESSGTCTGGKLNEGGQLANSTGTQIDRSDERKSPSSRQKLTSRFCSKCKLALRGQRKLQPVESRGRNKTKSKQSKISKQPKVGESLPVKGSKTGGIVMNFDEVGGRRQQKRVVESTIADLRNFPSTTTATKQFVVQQEGVKIATGSYYLSVVDNGSAKKDSNCLASANDLDTKNSSFLSIASKEKSTSVIMLNNCEQESVISSGNNRNNSSINCNDKVSPNFLAGCASQPEVMLNHVAKSLENTEKNSNLLSRQQAKDEREEYSRCGFNRREKITEGKLIGAKSLNSVCCDSNLNGIQILCSAFEERKRPEADVFKSSEKVDCPGGNLNDCDSTKLDSCPFSTSSAGSSYLCLHSSVSCSSCLASIGSISGSILSSSCQTSDLVLIKNLTETLADVAQTREGQPQQPQQPQQQQQQLQPLDDSVEPSQSGESSCISAKLGQLRNQRLLTSNSLAGLAGSIGQISSSSNALEADQGARREKRVQLNHEPATSSSRRSSFVSNCSLTLSPTLSHASMAEAGESRAKADSERQRNSSNCRQANAGFAKSSLQIDNSQRKHSISSQGNGDTLATIKEQANSG